MLRGGGGCCCQCGRRVWQCAACGKGPAGLAVVKGGFAGRVADTTAGATEAGGCICWGYGLGWLGQPNDVPPMRQPHQPLNNHHGHQPGPCCFATAMAAHGRCPSAHARQPRRPPLPMVLPVAVAPSSWRKRQPWPAWHAGLPGCKVQPLPAQYLSAKPCRATCPALQTLSIPGPSVISHCAVRLRIRP